MNIHDATEQAYKNGYEQGMKDATKWISVKDMPFEEYDYKTVLYYDGKDVDACYVINGNFVDIYSDCGRDIDGVTHWRPMPQPPKGE